MFELSRDPESYEAQLVREQAATAARLGYRHPRAPKLTEVVCRYCARPYRSERRHSTTCSAACRKALSVALAYECDADVPPIATRRDTWSEERATATGLGTVTASEGHALDLRVRRLAGRADND